MGGGDVSAIWWRGSGSVSSQFNVPRHLSRLTDDIQCSVSAVLLGEDSVRCEVNHGESGQCWRRGEEKWSGQQL